MDTKVPYRQSEDLGIPLLCVEPIAFAQTIKETVKSAIANGENFIVVTTAGHRFSDSYNKDSLISVLNKADEYSCDILCGGFGRFGVAVPTNSSLLWIDHYSSCNFAVIYKSFFERILMYNNLNSIDSLSPLTANKMVVYPFISNYGHTQAEVGDMPSEQLKKSTDNSFIRAENNLAIYLAAHKRLNGR